MFWHCARSRYGLFTVSEAVGKASPPTHAQTAVAFKMVVPVVSSPSRPSSMSFVAHKTHLPPSANNVVNGGAQVVLY